MKVIDFLHHRAIDIQALIGTVGGYIGLFLGYSVMQAPIVIAKLLKRMNRKRKIVKKNQLYSEP